MTAAELKRARLRLGLGPVDMAKLLSQTPYATYWRWESGRTPVPRWVAARVERLNAYVKAPDQDTAKL